MTDGAGPVPPGRHAEGDRRHPIGPPARAEPWVASTTSVVLLMAACTMMPRAIGALGPFIVSDLGLSPSRLGVLVSMVFAVSALTAIGCARIVDRLPAPRLTQGLLLVVMVNVTLVYQATAYLWLVLAVGLAGISQGLANPVANRVVRTSVPRRRRALAIGLKQSAVQLGTAFAAFVLPTLALALGWHLSVLALLALPLLALVVSLTVSAGSEARPAGPAARPAGRAAGSRDRRSGRPGPGRLRLRDEDGAWRLSAYSFFIAAGVSGVATYVPLYVHDVLGFSEATAGLVLGFVGVAAVVARIGWAQIAGARPESNLVAAIVAGAGAAAAILLAVSSLLGLSSLLAGPLAWVGAVGVGATAMGANAVSNLSVVRRSTTGNTGRSSSVVAFGFFAGFIPAPVVFGLVVESALGWSGAWAVVVLELALACWIVADRGRAAAWRARTGDADTTARPGGSDTDV